MNICDHFNRHLICLCSIGRENTLSMKVIGVAAQTDGTKLQFLVRLGTRRLNKPLKIDHLLLPPPPPLQLNHFKREFIMIAYRLGRTHNYQLNERINPRTSRDAVLTLACGAKPRPGVRAVWGGLGARGGDGVSLLVRESVSSVEQLLSRQSVLRDVAGLPADQVVRHGVGSIGVSLKRRQITGSRTGQEKKNQNFLSSSSRVCFPSSRRLSARARLCVPKPQNVPVGFSDKWRTGAERRFGSVYVLAGLFAAWRGAVMLLSPLLWHVRVVPSHRVTPRDVTSG